MIVEVIGTSGGTPIPNAGDYFSILFNTTSSGGTAVTPVNLNRTSTKVANVTITTGTPTVVVTSALEARRWYPQANGVIHEITPARADDTILGRSNTYCIRYITATTAGTILVMVKFMMMTADNLP